MKPCLFCKHVPKVFPINPEEEGDAFGEVRCVNVACPVNPVIKSCDIDKELGTEFHKITAVNKWNAFFTPTFTKEDVEKATEAILQLAYEKKYRKTVNMEHFQLYYPDMVKIAANNAKAALNAVGRVEE